MNQIIIFLIIPVFAAFITPAGSLINKKFANILNVVLYLFAIVMGLLIYPSLVGSTQVIAMGGWKAPFGISIVASPLAMGAGIAMYFIGFLIAINNINKERPANYNLLFNLFIFSSVVMVFTGDLFNLFVMMEIGVITTMALSASTNMKAGTRGSFKYVVNSGLVSMLILASIGLMYSALGTLNIAQIAAGPAMNSYLAFIVGAGILMALFFEAELFPFNAWVPDVYRGSHSSFGAALAGIAGFAGMLVMARVLFTLMNPSSSFQLARESLNNLLFGISIASILVGEIAALNAKDLKKLLAYSSIGQMGQVALAFAVAGSLQLSGNMVNTSPAIYAGLFLLIVHTLAKPMLLFITGFFIKATGKAKWEDMKGIGRVYPFMAVSFIIGGLTLMGIPLFAGFWGKIELVRALFAGNVLAKVGLGVLLFATVIEGVYFMKIGHSLFEGKTKIKPKRNGDFAAVLVPVVILLVCLMVFAFFPGVVNTHLRSFADSLFNSGGYVESVLTGVGL